MRRNEGGERPARRDELARWYAEALADQASSGLSVSEYANEIGVTASTLYQWRRRLAQGKADRQAGSPFGLVEVAIDDARVAARVGSGPMIVCLASSHRIEVPRGFDDAELRRLVTVLESC